MPRIYHPYLRGLAKDLGIRALPAPPKAYRYDSASETKEEFVQRLKTDFGKGLITGQEYHTYTFDLLLPEEARGIYNALGDREYWNESSRSFERETLSNPDEEYKYQVKLAEREKQIKSEDAKITGAESTTTRFVNWWKCSNKTSPGLAPDSFAQIACYLRNGFMVVGGVAAWVALIYVLGRGEKN